MIPIQKHLFAAYLNMARQNAFITLSHISKIIGGGTGSEENLSQMKPVRILTDNDALPEDVERTIKLLNKHFPFLKPMLNEEMHPGSTHKKLNASTLEKQSQNADKPEPELFATPEMYHKILTKVFNTLNRQRNQYTHARHENEPFDKDLISYMKNCFDGAVRVVKERFNLQDKEVNHLNRFREKSEITYDNRGRRKKGYEENPDFHYKFDNNESEITDKGLAFFTSLFLEREYANLLLSQIKGFKQSGQKGKEEGVRATKTVFSIYNIRIPKLRIDSESSTMTLGIDMLNELKKCPDELFEHLDATAQESFRIIPNDDNREEPEMQPNEDDSEGTVLLKRFENRFPQLALNYIDHRKLFSNVRFQIALGTYRHSFYDKQGVDQKVRVRILQKKLHGFGRLQEIEERRKREWATLIRSFKDTEKDHAETNPYITDTYAQYMISNNRVGMYWKIDEHNPTENGDCFPTLEDGVPKNQAPVCWLSIYELPAMIFHALLCDKKNETQYIIQDYARRYRKLFSDIRDGGLTPSPSMDVVQTVKDKYKIDFLRLPDEIRDYLSGKEKDIDSKFIELAEKHIEWMVKNTQGRQRKIENDIAAIQDNKRNRVGKKRYVEIKSGVLADFLAEDLLLFQPTQDEGKDKLTGVNYQTLQATLAYYGEHKDEMKQIFINCKLMDSPIVHPFLDKVMAEPHNDIVSFYRSYLYERENYLNKCMEEKKYRQYHFLHANRDKWQQRNPEYYKQLAKKYLDLPIELPRGLFNDGIKKLLNNQSKNFPAIKEALSQKKCNTVYLIQTYFKFVLKDGKQTFYDFSRNYKLLDMLNDRKIHNKLQQTFYSTKDFEKRLKKLTVEIDEYLEKQYQKERKRLQEKRHFRDLKKLEAEKESTTLQTRSKLKHLLNDFEKNEKILRLTQVQDMLLFLMAKKLLIDSQLQGIDGAVMEKYKLNEIQPKSDKDILSVQTSFSLQVKLNDGNLRTIQQEQLKLKNFGDFYRLVRDRRVETLLPHLLDETIDRPTLEKELDGYDSVRVEVFELIHNFERQMIEKKSIQMSSPDFVEILRQCPEINSDTKQQMQIIRNAFSHNTYPAKGDEVRDIESNDPKSKITVDFSLDGVMPDIARNLKKRLAELIENSLKLEDK